MATDVTATVRAVVAVVDQATGPLRAIQAQFKGFAAPIQTAVAKFKQLGETTGLSKLGSSLGGIAQKAGGVAKSIAGIGLSLVGLGGIAGGLGLRSVIGWMNDMVAAGGALHDTAPKIGVTVEQLQELRHWASMGGVEAGTMQGAIGKLNKNLGDIATGKGKAAAETLATLGVKTKDASGKVRSAAELLPAIADGLAKIESPAERAQIAMALFGRSGVEMLPALLEGGKAIAAAAAEARKLGLITAEEAKNADAFGEAQEKLGKAVRSVQYAIGAKLLPVLLPVIEGMREWVMANREWLATKVEQTITAVATALRQVDWAAWGERLRSVMALLGRFVELLGGVDKAILLLAAIKFSGPLLTLAKVLGSLIPLALQLGTALTAMVGGPVLLGLAALAAAAILIYKHWDRIGPAIAGVLEAIRGEVAAVLAAVSGFAAAIGAALADVLGPVAAWGARMATLFAQVWKDLVAIVAESVAGLETVIARALAPLIAIVTAWGRQFLAAFQTIWAAIKQSVGGAFTALAGAIGGELDKVRAVAATAWAALQAVFKTGWTAIQDVLAAFRGALDGIAKVLGGLAAVAERALGGVATAVTKAKDAVSGFWKSASEPPPGIVTPGTGKAAGAGVGGLFGGGGKPAEPAVPPGIARPPARGPGPWLPELATPGGSAPSGTVNVVIENKNAPPGTRMTAKATGKGVRTQADVGYSMPQLQPASAG